MGDIFDSEIKLLCLREDIMDNDATVTIELDDGSTIECAVLMIFEAGNEDREYIAVMPEGGDDDSEIYLYRYSEDEKGEPKIENIESDEEYDIVSEAFDEILDEQEYNEMVAEGGNINEEDAY